MRVERIRTIDSTKIDYRIIGIGMLWERRDDDALARDDRISSMQGGSVWPSRGLSGGVVCYHCCAYTWQ